MKTGSPVLTEEERHILLLVVHNLENHLSNSEIALFLGLSVNRVKTLIHRACVKLGAHNRNEAVMIALQRGELGLDELLSLDELAETFSSLGPDGLRRIAHLVRQEREDGHLPEMDEPIIPAVRRQDSILTNRERDVVILAGRGLTNKEMADALCMSTHAVRTFLNRASTKLGARKRAEAITLAIRQGEIGIGDLASPHDVFQALARLGADSIEKMALLLGQKPGSTGS
jgi:DNA-binding CsgD family transcriptional regulator